MSEHSSVPKFELSPSVSIIIAGALIAGSIIFVNLHPASVADAGAGAAAAVPIPSSSDHIIGSLSAPIVLIEYSDFQCPYCSMIYPTLKQIVSENNGQIAWVMREYPLYQIHPQALPAAQAAECINEQLGNDAFWKYADTVFNNQQLLTPEYSAQIAGLLGANTAAYNTCVSTSKFAAKIDQESADAQTSGGEGTPFTVVYNTKTGKQYPIAGALPYAQIVSVINRAKNSQ